MTNVDGKVDRYSVLDSRIEGRTRPGGHAVWTGVPNLSSKPGQKGRAQTVMCDQATA